MRAKLTKRLIDSTTPHPEKDVFLWDEALPGCGLRVKRLAEGRKGEVKTFIVQYRTPHGRTRRFAVARYRVMTLEEARTEARQILARAEKGEDPSADRKKARAAKTVSDLADSYYTDAEAGRVLHRGRPKKPLTLQTDKGRIERHIKPLLGTKPIEGLTRQDVIRFMNAVQDGKTAARFKTGRKRGLANVRGGRGAAAKCVTLLGAMFTYAERQGWVSDNPCRGIEKPASIERQRHLTDKEYAALGKALIQMEAEGANNTALNAIRALALTGCRKGEILNLKAAGVDKAARGLRLEDTKTGRQLRPCGNTALVFLADLSAGFKKGGGWAFPATRGDGPLVGVVKPFARACAIAKIRGATLHTLRHSFATVAHELGFSELTIAGLLGHRAGSVTARYAHHVDSALAAAADRVSAVIAARMEGRERRAGEVVNLPTRATGAKGKG